MRIDSHQHFWHYSEAEFDWIDDRMAGLRRNFLPADFAPLRARHGLDGTIAVQARQSMAETRWLLDLARSSPWILGVIGWVDLCSPHCAGELDALASERRLVGIRHVLQAEAADFALRPEFARGIAKLAPRRLVYDLLVRPSQLAAVTELCQQQPQQTFVLDHLAKPVIAARELPDWSRQLRALALLPNVHCKLSGLVTEADWASWSPTGLEPWFEVALQAFGPGRLLFGSDWPVCLCAASYDRWLGTVESWLQRLDLRDRQAVLGGTACSVYRLQPAFS